MIYRNDSKRLSRTVYRVCLETCVQNVNSERINQKGASVFDFIKKVSNRKMTQASNQKIEYEVSWLILEHGMIL